MVKQMRGEYKVKNEALRELSLRAGRLAREIGSVRYTAVRREAQGKLADRLVNEALDAPVDLRVLPHPALPPRGCSSSWLERLLAMQKVVGSSPIIRSRSPCQTA